MEPGRPETLRLGRALGTARVRSFEGVTINKHIGSIIDGLYGLIWFNMV